MADGEPLPADVLPAAMQHNLTGEMAVTQLRAELRHARAAGAEAIRLECSSKCRCGHACHLARR